jgi:hypothetical protein
MKDTPEIVEARAEAERRRTRLMASAEQLQERLSPKRLTKDAWEGAKDKGADLAENAVDAVRSRPIAAGGTVAAIALFLAREPLIELAGSLAGKLTSTKKPKTQKPKTQKAPPRTRRRPTKPSTETVE